MIEYYKCHNLVTQQCSHENSEGKLYIELFWFCWSTLKSKEARGKMPRETKSLSPWVA